MNPFVCVKWMLRAVAHCKDGCSIKGGVDDSSRFLFLISLT
jgi:hypothetical protein